MNTDVTLSRALISVSDKSGLLDLAQALVDRNVELISTGGTARALREAGFAVKDVSEITGFPEMMDGRVKTLHPKVHGGLLALRDNPAHMDAAKTHEIAPIDLLVVNLYPFESTVASGADLETCIENIDIGGPAMIRAAAKNHGDVAVVVDPADYAGLIGELGDTGVVSAATRKRLAQTAFARTAAYDAAVSNYLASAYEIETPSYRAVGGALSQSLRYGENPHQKAALYTTNDNAPGLVNGTLLQGKALSYNNINDGDAAFALVSDFDGQAPACVIVKHANPCGVARGESLAEAYARAFDCDRTSAFGGIVAFNQPLDAETAEKVTEIFTEVVIAPVVSEGAREVFAKKPNLRLIETGGLMGHAEAGALIRPVSGGFLMQSADTSRIARDELKVVTKRAPTEAEWADLQFAWGVAKHVKSNAIVYVKDGATVGIGAGQMSRVDSTRIAARKAQDMAEALGLAEPLTVGSSVASDAFFPFADGVLTAAEAGATALIQPGGAMRDEEVIAAADEAGLAMVFTGMRHFRH